MSWNFTVLPTNQSEMYKVLTDFWGMGKVGEKQSEAENCIQFQLKAPILFPASNASADYSSKDWMRPCYERFYEVGGKYVIYWLVNGDMYCEAIVRGTLYNYKPTFAQKYLFRAEYQKTWCPQ
uniref:Uncharacterized protein n=2 Tax=Caenorhabditis japonica TaxID=281687 RepID=A0A8R1EKE3_CAEJA